MAPLEQTLLLWGQSAPILRDAGHKESKPSPQAYASASSPKLALVSLSSSL